MYCKMDMLGWKPCVPPRILLMLLFVVHWTFCQPSLSISDNMRIAQFDESCEEAVYNGGDEYFNQKFAPFIAELQAQLSELVLSQIASSVPGPNTRVRNAINAIRAVDNLEAIEDISLVFGLLSTPVYCYTKDAQQKQCSATDRLLFTDTSVDSWSYQYDCRMWKAKFSMVTVKFTSGKLHRVVASVTVKLDGIDINQCSDSTDPLFTGTAFCPGGSQCTFIRGGGFVVGSYDCRCTNCSGVSCESVSGTDLGSHDDPLSYFMSKCGEDLQMRSTTTPSSIGAIGPATPPFNQSIKLNCDVLKTKCPEESIGIEIYVILAIQGLCIFGCIVISVVVVLNRPKEVIQYSKYFILLLILFGACLNYSSLALKLFPATTVICYLTPWFREVAFMCIYGSVMLKTYKVLAEFQTRKARRVHIRDKDLLKYWITCLLICVIYLAAWTALNISNSVGQLVVAVHSSQGGLQMQCQVTGWNYVTQCAEVLILAFGLYMSYRLRAASSYFWESKFYATVLTLELIFTLAYYILWLVLRLNLYWSFLLSFIHLQLTTTVCLILIFGPKLYYIRHSPKEGVFLSKNGQNKTDFVDFRMHGKPGATNNGDVNLEDINIAEMNPDDIRAELRRLYEVVHSYQDRIMRYENPHLHSKKPHHKSKLPFYKQRSSNNKPPQKKSNKSTSDIKEIDGASPGDKAELEPLNPPSVDPQPSNFKRTANF